MSGKPRPQTKALVTAARKMTRSRYVLRLYVAGMTRRSSEAIRRVTDFCETHLDGRYDLEIVDIYQRPALLKGEQIIAVPTLVKQLPAPLRRFIGDMHDEQRLLFGMDLPAKSLKTRSRDATKKEKGPATPAAGS